VLADHSPALPGGCRRGGPGGGPCPRPEPVPCTRASPSTMRRYTDACGSLVLLGAEPSAARS
jgi:hypothetical protein